MMCGVILIPLAFIQLVGAQLSSAKQRSNSQDFIDKLVGKMFDRTFEALPLDHTDLDQTTLAKTHLGIKNGGTTYSTLPSITASPPFVNRPLFHEARFRHLPISHALEEHKVIQAAVAAPTTAAAVAARKQAAKKPLQVAVKKRPEKPQIAEVPRAAVAITTCRTKGTWEQGPWEYLLIKRSTPPAAGTWSIPSGKVELGENIMQAAARELGEETSLAASNGVRFNPWSVGTSETIYPYGTKFHYVIPLIFAFATQTDAVAHAGDDAVDFRWFTLGELEEGLLEINEREKTVAFLQRMEAWMAAGVLRPDDAVAVEPAEQVIGHWSPVQ